MKPRHKEEVQEKVSRLGPRARTTFAASIAERLLPGARQSMDRWHPGSWNVLRNALDRIWDHLRGNTLSTDETLKLRQHCREQIPHSEDENWDGSFGVFGAGSVIDCAVESVIVPDPNIAAEASNQAIEEIRQYLIFKLFGDEDILPEFDECQIFSSEIIQTEIEKEDCDLAILTTVQSNGPRFDATLEQIRSESIGSPIQFPN